MAIWRKIDQLTMTWKEVVDESEVMFGPWSERKIGPEKPAPPWHFDNKQLLFNTLLF